MTWWIACYRRSRLTPFRRIFHSSLCYFSYGIRSAVKNFGIERFKTNCHRATDGFNLVMAHLHTRQQYLKDMQMKKFQQIRQTGETVIARYGHKSMVSFLHYVSINYDRFGWMAKHEAFRNCWGRKRQVFAVASATRFGNFKERLNYNESGLMTIDLRIERGVGL